MSVRALAALAATTTVLAYVAMPGTAQAAARFCAEHDTITGKLNEKYKEHRTGMGLVGSTGVVELYTAKTGTWTILVTKVDGTSCVVATGSSWSAYNPRPKLSGT